MSNKILRQVFFVQILVQKYYVVGIKTVVIVVVVVAVAIKLP